MSASLIKSSILLKLWPQKYRPEKILKRPSGVFDRFKNIKKPQCGDIQEQLLSEITQAFLAVFQAHEMIESLWEAYQSAVDNRANDIMKMLTLVATIILPISVLTGFFGMNFETLPSIHQTYGIYVFFSLSAIIFLVVIIYFWKKKWLK